MFYAVLLPEVKIYLETTQVQLYTLDLGQREETLDDHGDSPHTSKHNTLLY